MPKEIDAQVQITAEFGKQASKAVGDFAQSQTIKARLLIAQANMASDTAKRDELLAQAQAIDERWSGTGTLRFLEHTLFGALTGGASGAAGAATGTLTASLVADALHKAGIDGPLASTLTALASTAAGGAGRWYSGGGSWTQ